ncbi:MAG: cytochrome oxidase small assembly protein [Sutterellaceae bacterium]|nr:cytochrome oxidase small assembly protein [Burkholderiaceae bacterium]MCX7901271.1 cytochrome oxidase small assembly protein [Burkholderiaceae bacterium]MDW8429421.1 cytochrome oxidase small assembly protein [Sutterellaceae bacterium]
MQQLRIEARKRNVRTALVLASIALVFFLGIVARYWLLGQ